MSDPQELAAIVSKGVRRLIDAGVEVIEAPRIGPFTVYASKAALIDDFLQGLTDSIVERKGCKVGIRWAYRIILPEGLVLTLDVVDDGMEVLARHLIGTTTLARLRRRIQGGGGKLNIWHTTEGNMFRLEFRLY